MNRPCVATGVEVAGPRAAAAWVMLGLGALLAVAVTLAGDATVTAGAVAAVSFGALVAVASGILRHRPQNRRFWWLCLFALATGVVAGVLGAVPATADHPVLIDLTFLVGYTLFMAAVLTALPKRRGESDWTGLLDAFVVATAGGIAIWYLWISPALRADVSVHTVITGLIWPLYDLALLVLIYRLAISGEPSRFPLTMVVIGEVSSVVTDVMYVTQGGALMGTSLDALWLMPMTALGAAALHPQMRTFGTDPQRTPLRITAVGVFWISTATFAVPILVGAHAWRAGRLEDDAPALFAAVVVLVVLGAARSAETVRLLRRSLEETQGLQDELAHSATHDALTGLANRRLLRERLDALFADRRRSGAVLLFLDLDDFKNLNDTLGHQAGDQALVEVGTRIREALRPGNLVVRLGGDEFAVLLDSADLDTVNAIGDRLLANISKPFVIGRTPVSLHASIGAARADLAATSDELVSKADRAMYQAKAAGKNKIELFDPERPEPEPVSRWVHELAGPPA